MKCNAEGNVYGESMPKFGINITLHKGKNVQLYFSRK